MLHVLPKGFAKVRYYGLLAGRKKKERIKLLKIKTKTALQKIAKRTLIEILNSITGKDITKCRCGGDLELIKTERPKRSPPYKFTTELMYLSEA